MQIRSRDNVAADPHSPTNADTLGTSAWWLLTQQTASTKNLVVNMCELPAGTTHQVHRHAHAEQVVIVMLGSGLHLGERGVVAKVEVGEVVHIPAGEWHGFANPFSSTAIIATVYGGVNRREDAGYELHPRHHFDASTYEG